MAPKLDVADGNLSGNDDELGRLLGQAMGKVRNVLPVQVYLHSTGNGTHSAMKAGP